MLKNLLKGIINKCLLVQKKRNSNLKVAPSRIAFYTHGCPFEIKNQHVYHRRVCLCVSALGQSIRPMLVHVSSRQQVPKQIRHQIVNWRFNPPGASHTFLSGQWAYWWSFLCSPNPILRDSQRLQLLSSPSIFIIDRPTATVLVVATQPNKRLHGHSLWSSVSVPSGSARPLFQTKHRLLVVGDDVYSGFQLCGIIPGTQKAPLAHLLAGLVGSCSCWRSSSHLRTHPRDKVFQQAISVSQKYIKK